MDAGLYLDIGGATWLRTAGSSAKQSERIVLLNLNRVKKLNNCKVCTGVFHVCSLRSVDKFVEVHARLRGPSFSIVPGFFVEHLA